MPSAQAITSQLELVTNQAIALAIAWHVVIAAGLAAILVGWRPSARSASALLVLPIGSASAVAFAFGNPFNGTVLAVLALTLAVLAARSRNVALVRGPVWAEVAGMLMLAFGLFYPHFLVAHSPLSYLYAAPTGLIPCPTLSVVVGFGLLAGGLKGTRAWSLALAAVGLFYGVFGVARLGVLLDIPLVLGASALFVVGGDWLQRIGRRREPSEQSG
jgi:hypothetical protein